jgi:hypothetical protein
MFIYLTILDGPMKDRVCEICGNIYTPKDWDQKCCSKDCSRKRKNQLRKKPRPPVVCKVCGITIEHPSNNQKYCSSCRKDMKVKSANEYYIENKEEVISRLKTTSEENKLICLVHYSGDPPKCQCCGESELVFLTFDHINGDGNKHRKEDPSSRYICKWLIKNNFPEGVVQVLCWNCQEAKRILGYCPHELRKDGFRN